MNAWRLFMSKRAVMRYLHQERARCILSIEAALREENPSALLKWFDALAVVNNQIKACGKS